MQELYINGNDLKTEADRLNMCDLATKILDAQAEDNMQELTIDFFANMEENQEVKDEDNLIIDSIVQSGQTHLALLSLVFNETWFGDTETTALFCDFIK